MATLAGIEVRQSPARNYRIGVIWEKLWKQTEVAGKAAKFAMVQWKGCNFVAVQWAGLLFWNSTSGRA